MNGQSKASEGVAAIPDSRQIRPFSGLTIQCPGLTPGAQEIHALRQELPKGLAVLSYKAALPCLWIVLVGGTGTGKSTLFNALCKAPLSETGVERPKTFGPVVYAHGDCPLEKDFPFTSVQIDRRPADTAAGRPEPGQPGRLLVLTHEQSDLSHLALADTPDLDSVEAVNREIAHDLYLLCDAVVFVTSQEKYADDIPYQLLLRIIEEEKPLFFILNKADPGLTRREVVQALQGQGLLLPEERIWLIPRASGRPRRRIAKEPSFRDFSRFLFKELSPKRRPAFQRAEQARQGAQLKRDITRLITLLEAEEEAGRKWTKQLEALCRERARDLVREEKTRFAAQSRAYLQKEIRRLFARYDILATPRRFVKNLLVLPLRLLGLGGKDPLSRQQGDLSQIRQRIVLAPVQEALEKFNRAVLETLSPDDETAPLFRALREAGVHLSDRAVEERIIEEQERIAAWLKETFHQLSRGIPKSKEWGIYSTSLLWGILIISFETVVGGGFTILDAALDSAIAPFVTKGAVELFAYREIQSIARELAGRYQEGLLSTLYEQRDRYARCLRSLMSPSESLEALQEIRSLVDKGGVPRPSDP